MGAVPLSALVEGSAALAATRSRLAKRTILSGLLRQAAAADHGGGSAPGPSQLELVTAYLSGTLRQRRTGVGWRRLMELPEPATASSLTLTMLDDAFDQMAGAAGAGSSAARTAAVTRLMERATRQEQDYLRALMTGNVRQGSLDSLILDGIAEAFDVLPEEVRRAAFLGGSSAAVAQAAADQQRTGEPLLAGFRLQLHRPVRPMLASSAPDTASATAGFTESELIVDCKLDGIRIQVHKDPQRVSIHSRSLDDITDQLPDVVAAIQRLPEPEFVIDGEVLAMTPDGRPEPFQVSNSRSQTMTAHFFDALQVGGEELIDLLAVDRLAALERVVPATMIVPRTRAFGEPQELAEQAQGFFCQMVSAGHEGVVVKDPQAPYAAGRRGAAWVKVKPRHTFDLVVLAVERGSGRRRGTLSNIHLGARDPDSGDFVMVGKTFKGMTDEMLAWQTRRFTELASHEGDYVVTVRPEQVVEIAIDGVQRSSRYPGGVALRFARVLRYREDKTAAEADTIDTIRTLGPDAGSTSQNADRP